MTKIALPSIWISSAVGSANLDTSRAALTAINAGALQLTSVRVASLTVDQPAVTRAQASTSHNGYFVSTNLTGILNNPQLMPAGSNNKLEHLAHQTHTTNTNPALGL
jgi:hypothetical protein